MRQRFILVRGMGGSSAARPCYLRAGHLSSFDRVCYIYQKLFLKLTVLNKLLPPSLLHLFRNFPQADGVRQLPAENQYHLFRNFFSADGMSKLPAENQYHPIRNSSQTDGMSKLPAESIPSNQKLYSNRWGKQATGRSMQQRHRNCRGMDHPQRVRHAPIKLR